MAVAERRGDLAVVLATGGGKTAVVIGPCLYEEGGTVWVSPLRALLRETDMRLNNAGIQTSRLEDMNVDGKGLGRVLLVAPEQVGVSVFRGVIEALIRRRKLNRVVVDEAHIAVLSQSYRECMVQLKSASRFGTACPVVLLTATAPARMVAPIAEACGSSVQSLEVIRGDPCRKNLSISVTRLRDGDAGTLLVEVVKVVKESLNARLSNAMGRCSRCLIVCLTIGDADELGRELRVMLFYGNSLEEGQVLV